MTSFASKIEYSVSLSWMAVEVVPARLSPMSDTKVKAKARKAINPVERRGITANYFFSLFLLWPSYGRWSLRGARTGKDRSVEVQVILHKIEVSLCHNDSTDVKRNLHMTRVLREFMQQKYDHASGSCRETLRVSRFYSSRPAIFQ